MLIEVDSHGATTAVSLVRRHVLEGGGQVEQVAARGDTPCHLAIRENNACGGDSNWGHTDLEVWFPVGEK